MMIEPVLNAALQMPAIVFPGLSVFAPAKTITGVGYMNLRRSQTSLILKSELIGLWTRTSFAG
jgi:hypothetical protein